MAGTDTGKENGYVVALKSVDCKWDFGTTSEYISIGGEGGLTSTEFCAIKNGYTRTKLYNCSSFLETKFTKVTSTTSGWYIPAPAQFIEMLINLGEYTPGEEENYNANNSQARIDAIKNLKSKIKAAGGTDFAEFTWMCIEPSSSNTWAFHSKESKNNPIFNGGRSKKSSYNLRPVLAF